MVDEFAVLAGPHKADQPAVLAKKVGLVYAELAVFFRRAHLYYHVRFRPRAPNIVHDLGPGLAVLAVRAVYLVSGSGLDSNIETQFFKANDRLRCGRNSAFRRMDLFRDTDLKRHRGL